MPRVSIIVNTFNHERFISRALGSVLDQDFSPTDTEIIVVDDGSADRTGEIACGFHPRIRYIRKPNEGQVSAFSVGIAAACGELIAFLDGDDWWTNDKLSKVVDAFDRYPEIAAIGHGYYEVDEAGSPRGAMSPESEYRLNFSTVASARFAANLRVFGGTSRMAMRRSALLRTLPVPSELPFFDNFIFTQAIAVSGALLLPQLLCYYRLHSGNLYASESSDRSRLERRYALQRGLVEYLPARLAGLGVSSEIASAALECDRVDAERLRLLVEGGAPWRTFLVERADFLIAYRNPSPGYRLFKYLVLFLTLILPPRTFYRFRRWYTEHNLRRVRGWFGRATSTVPGGVHRSVQTHRGPDS